MKRSIMTPAVVMAIMMAVSAGDLFAAGRNNVGNRNGTSLTGQGSAGTTATRPAGSQRRDGTFLTTGTTANGGTTRPDRGNGLQDGSRLNTGTPEPATAQ
ncbi:MAG: hypothetical protein U1D97_09665 [Desulfuromonadales bacterium]|nr:hypothetical protein [Desulfuromonadales bacterium]